MKKLFSWLIKPVVLSLIGVLLVALIIWFEAPLLSFDGSAPFASESVRWTCIIVVFLLWAGYFVWKMVAARLANLKLMKSVAGEDAPPAPPGAKESAAEIEVLNKRMAEAMAILRKSKNAGKGGLYQLPWYMFIGAPGTGKTTALTQSGLKFPLAEAMGKGAIGGVGGTRNCDWWFTDDAVLLDTAGRYTTQDSHADVDKAGWNGFLQLLRRHRKRRPINGIIVALSVADLLKESEAWRRGQSTAIRERIKELHEGLGIRPPVYVLVTKCDLLAGFIEYFDTLSREERAQVWGVTFPLDAAAGAQDAALASFPQEFRLLEQQLQARVLDRMQAERDPHKRALIYSFPQQFAGVGEVLERFLKDVFESNRYDQPALLRGVYFSSGTQEGSPLDRVMSAMAASFGLDRQVLPANGATGRSYFLTNLLQQVIFPEAELAGVNQNLEKRRRLFAWGALAGVAVLFVLLGAGMITSYVKNSAYVAEMDAKATALAKEAAALPAQGSTLELLPLLDRMRALQADYSDDAGAPWSMRFGLYQGEKLGKAAQIAYHRVLRETLLPRIVGRMEEQLRRSSANNAEYLYEVLRVYLMLGDASHFDAESVAAWVAYDDERNLQDASDEQREALSAHELALLSTFRDEQAMPPLDAQLISDTRLTLARMPIEQRVYNRLKRELTRAKLPEFSPAVAGGRDASSVLVRRSGEPLTRGVNGMFSVAGHAKFLEASQEALGDVEKERWVLAQQEASTLSGDAAQVRAAVQQLYYEDYIAEWDKLLADVTVTSFANLDQGARIANLLSGAESPLKKFMTAAARETKLGNAKPAALASVSQKVQGKLSSYKKKLESALGGPIDDPLAAPPKTANPVDAHFEDLHKLTTGTPAPLDGTLAMLKDVAVYLDAAAAAKRTGAPPPPGEALSRLKLEADGKPAPLGAVLKTIDSSGAGLASGSERERLNALWTAGPAQFCRQALAGRYPLVRSASLDVTADDFGKLFAPGGLIDDFFQKNLLQYVDMGGGQWRWRATANNASLGMSQGTLDEFQRASRIRDAFFANGGRQASMRFELKPVSIDPALTKFTLDIDGQPFNALPAGGGAGQFQLPSGKGSGAVRLEAAPAGAHANLRTDGPWAWYRMLDKATVEATPQGERFKVSFDVDGKKAVLEMTASSVVNPFRRGVLEQFRCMDRL